MLLELSVQNLALVEACRIPFGEGLNVITGETGAGKSVLMGALQLIMGARADRKVLRSGSDQGSVQALFSLREPEAINALLEEAGFPPCEEGELLIRRVLRSSGSGQQFINDESVTLNLLRKLGDLLVDMHGPYDHQSLLLPETQRNMVDAVGQSHSEVKRYRDAWVQRRELRSQIDELQGDEAAMARELDLLRFQVTELDEAALQPQEEEELLEEHTRIGNAQNLMEGLHLGIQALQEAEGNAFDALAAARRGLDSLQGLHPEAEAWMEEIDDLQSRSQELAASLQLSADRCDSDPERLYELDDRLGLYSKLKRKYGPSVEETLTHLERSRERLQALENREATLLELEGKLKHAEEQLASAGEQLRRARAASAAPLATQILEQIHDLGFAHARFDIVVDPAEAAPHGADEVRFRFAPNPGEDMRDLKDIASSGEISRVMLAIKTLLAEHDRIPVMVFDEIDANVGGEMGHAIGRKMSTAASTRQILSITHLPQVAVHGAHHLAVHKEVQEGRSFTRVRVLEGEARESEVARMLGGGSGIGLQHARELLEAAAL